MRSNCGWENKCAGHRAAGVFFAPVEKDTPSWSFICFAFSPSLIFFLANKYVLFHLALPMMACNVAGSYIGSRMAVLRGNTFIRKVFLVVVAGIILRFAWDVVSSFRH